ncbi:hypothetical protein C8Q77DRAFT_108304 [Trametes polyzona]|nr:hypothetical protein C8Q77DRAFT_108304 [Trametes polyzona]
MYTEKAPPPPRVLQLLHVPCKFCNQIHCRGCMAGIDCPLTCNGKSNGEECLVTKCCAEVRACPIRSIGWFRSAIPWRTCDHEQACSGSSSEVSQSACR